MLLESIEGKHVCGSSWSLRAKYTYTHDSDTFILDPKQYLCYFLAQTGNEKYKYKQLIQSHTDHATLMIYI